MCAALFWKASHRIACPHGVCMPLVLAVVSVANGQFVRGTLQGVVTDEPDGRCCGRHASR